MIEINKYERNRIKAEGACEIANDILRNINYIEESVNGFIEDINAEMEKPEEERSSWRIESSERSKYAEEQKVGLYKELLKYIDKEWMIF